MVSDSLGGKVGCASKASPEEIPYGTKMPQISKAHVSRIQGRTKSEQMPVLTIEYSDFQDVQVIHDRMSAAKYILGANIDICEKVTERLLCSSETNLLVEEMKLQSTRVDNLIERTKSGSVLVSTKDCDAEAFF